MDVNHLPTADHGPESDEVPGSGRQSWQILRVVEDARPPQSWQILHVDTQAPVITLDAASYTTDGGGVVIVDITLNEGVVSAATALGQPMSLTQLGPLHWQATFNAPAEATSGNIIITAVDHLDNQSTRTAGLIVGEPVEPEVPPAPPAAPASVQIWPSEPIVRRHEDRFPASYRRVEYNVQTFRATFARVHRQIFPGSFTFEQSNTEVFKLSARVRINPLAWREDEEFFDLY